MIPLFLESNTSSSSSEDLYILLLLAQGFVGVLQLVIALALTIDRLVRKKPMRGLKVYWVSVAVYFGVLIALLVIKNSREIEIPEELLIGWFHTAWLIAFYMPFFWLLDPKKPAQVPPAAITTTNN